MRRALITGITGQDGSYLAEHLLGQGYEVFGLARGQNNPKRQIVEQMLPDVSIVEGDLLDQHSLVNVVQAVQPDEIYNLAAISYVPMSWQQPELTGSITGLGALRLLEVMRMTAAASPSRTGSARGIRFYQASSSEMFGKVHQTPQSEETPFHPQPPTGSRKRTPTTSPRTTVRATACSLAAASLFNHESPRRGPEFVTRKITMAAAAIKAGTHSALMMGNLDAKRDWGFAGDYVRAMHLMLQQPEADDFVIGTGETHSSGSSSTWRSPAPGSIPNATSASTRSSSGRLRSTCCSPSRGRRIASSDGRLR